MKHLSRLVIFTVVCGLSASAAAAGDLKLSIANGRVTLMAQDVPVRQILAEWARVGKTTIINADKIVGPSVTLQLVDQPEREALEILLRTGQSPVAGYVAAPRSVVALDASQYDRIMILPTSRPPAFTASAPPPPQFSRPPQPVNDDDQPVGDIAPMVPPQAPPGITYPGQNVPGQNVPPQQMQPQNVPGQPQMAPGQPPQPSQQPTTAPRPGMLPTVPGVQPTNPYGTPTAPLPPGVRPPGPGGPGGGPGNP
jgi:hypothetical protein